MKNNITNIADKFKKDLEFIIGERLIQVNYSDNNVDAILGIDYFSKTWFTENHNRIIKTLNEYDDYYGTINFSLNEYA